jgi:triphosphatase
VSFTGHSAILRMHGTAPMPHKEVEVKLELEPANLPALKNLSLLRAVKRTPKPAAQVSVYFDTEKQTLRKKGLMLRVRRQGRHYIQTIKANSNSASFERDEWETDIAGKKPDLTHAADTALEPLVTKKLRRRLKPLFETRVQRTVYPVVNGAQSITLAVDQGTIKTATKVLPLCEIELELERGRTTDLFNIARELTRTLPARLAIKSKSERGYELIDGEQEFPVKAARIDLPDDTNARGAFKLIALACLKQVIDNEPALLKGDPEGVHQMRVGLRRLRAAVSLFSVLLHDPQTAAIKTELKWLANELGPARELDVLVRRVIAPMKRQRRRWWGMPSLSQEVAERRNTALARAQEAVQSKRFGALTVDIAAWLHDGQWTDPSDDLIHSKGDAPVRAFAAEQLARRWRKVRKKGRVLVQLGARGRHKLRIHSKKLRYAAEFFADLFARKRAVRRRKQFISVLERLQDALGDLNDIAVHEKRIAAIGISRRQSSPSRAFAAGLLTGREEARVEAAVTVATQAYADLAKIKSFWR